KGRKTARLFRFAGVGLTETVVIIGAGGLDSYGAFQAGNGAVIIAQLIKTAAQPIMQRRFLRLSLDCGRERLGCLAVKSAVIEAFDMRGQFAYWRVYAGGCDDQRCG